MHKTLTMETVTKRLRSRVHFRSSLRTQRSNLPVVSIRHRERISRHRERSDAISPFVPRHRERISRHRERSDAISPFVPHHRERSEAISLLADR